MLIIAAGSALAQDVVVMNNAMKFEGKAVEIVGDSLDFVIEGDLYSIPTSEIQMVLVADTTDTFYQHASAMENANVEPCMMGQYDAEMYHGKKGAHFALGVLFGPFAMIGTAICNPTPEKGKNTYLMSQNKALFSDPAYISCYKKKARGQMLGYDALGWATWLLLLLCL